MKPRDTLMETASFTIQGMHCEGCAQIIQNALERLEGVQACSVSYESGHARVLFDPTRLTRESIACTIEKAGYRAEAQPPRAHG